MTKYKRWLDTIRERKAQEEYKGHPALMCFIQPDEREFEWKPRDRYKVRKKKRRSK